MSSAPDLSSMEILQHVRVPEANSAVYKDECQFCHDTPYSPLGLFVSLHSFLGFGRDYVELDHTKSGRKWSLYLNLKKIKKDPPPKETRPDGEPAEKKPKKLAIGVEGGFEVDNKIEYEDVNSLVVLPGFHTFPLPNPELPVMINLSIDQILVADSAHKREDVSIWVAEPRVESKHARTLVQLDNGVKIPPKGWKCERCDKTDNLWLNLTSGAILCGRKNFDGTGGNGHALQYYEETKYPLAVKLGTISKEGASDIYSYPEDDMVEDPRIKEHLKHFGIDMDAMSKSEKSLAEMEVDQNMSYEFSRLQEGGKKLAPIYGPGYTGMINIGSSCYLASVMQVVFTVPHFIDRYVAPAEEIFKNATDAAADFRVQMAKLGKGLLSGKYSHENSSGISPRSFKHLVGKGHPEFSTFKQQDAMEFYQHLLDYVDRKERAAPGADKLTPTKAFKFLVQDRVECNISHQVKYTTRVDNLLSVPVPLDAATNKEELAAYEVVKKNAADPSKLEMVRPRIPFLECLRAFAEAEAIPDFYSTATKMKGPASKSTHLASFPPYLMVQVRKFTLGDDWVPRKLDILLDIPTEVDFSFLRGKGLQPGEKELPEEDPKESASSAAAAQEAPGQQIDEGLVMQLVDMGFDVEGCRKAVFYTKNSGIEPAMNWVLEHMGDPDFTAPLVIAKPAAQQAKEEPVNEEAIMIIESMGFNRKQALKALKATGGNLERAGDWLFSHVGELDAMEVDEQAPQGAGGNAAAAPAALDEVDDGNGRYRLKAIITHIGSSTSCGHYVCHIHKDGKWIFYNDEAVSISEDTPMDLGYLYLFERL